MHTTIRSGLAGAAALTLAVLTPVATASAQSSGEPIITNTETVNVTLDPSGNVEVARLYDQIAIQGSGDVEYTNPVSTAGLRNLDEFGGFSVEGDAIVESASVDGQQRRRALADFDLELPITVSATYSLDGQPIDPADLVGKSGTVDAVFRVENMTGSEEEISYPDGTGGIVTETAMVYDPYAGSLAFTLPPNFTDVTSADGFVTAGDGRGGTLMNYGITLISGLTEPVAEVSYTATVSDAVIPPVTLSVLPVVVEDAPSATAQLAALESGVESGQELASNGELLDENVLALASGAAELVNGLILLDEGAQELSAGLVNDAAPGANQLADGLNELNGQVPALVDGVGQLNAGGTELAGGLSELDAQVPALVSGVSQLDDGAQQVAAGAAGLNDGLAQLAGAVDQLPQSIADELANNQQYQQLIQALQGIIDGIGTRPAGPVADVQTLSEALTNLEFGLDNTACDPDNPEDPANPCGFKQVLEILGAQLSSGSPASGVPNLGDPAGLQAILGTLDAGGAREAVTYLMSPDMLQCNQDTPQAAALGSVIGEPVKACGAVDRTSPSSVEPEVAFLVLGGLLQDIGAPDLSGTALYAISGLIDGIGTPSDFPAGPDDTLYYGLEGVRFSLTNPSCDKSDPTNANNPCGIKEVVELVNAGVPALVDELVSGIQQQLQAALGTPSAGCDPTATLRCGSAALAAGSGDLADGLSQLNAQTGPLASGVDQLVDGANQLSAGLGELNGQTGPLADGVTQLADGGNQLATGLGDAADGSVQLSSGLEDAAEAGPALPQGAQQLSEEGTSQLVEAGEDTAQSFGARVALIQAAADRTADGGLPYGGPQDAIVAAAYRYDLSEATGATAQNTGQLVAGLVIAGAAVAGATVLARRKTA